MGKINKKDIEILVDPSITKEQMKLELLLSGGAHKEYLMS